MCRVFAALLLIPSTLSRPVPWAVKGRASVTPREVFDSSSSWLFDHPRCDQSPSNSVQIPQAEYVVISRHPLGDIVWHADGSLRLPHLQLSFEPWHRLWMTLIRHVGNAASKLGSELQELKDFVIHAVDDAPPTPNDEGEYVEWYDGADASNELWRPADEEGYDSPNPRQPPLLVAVAVAALALGLFSLWYLHVRTVGLCVEGLPTASK
ncbi:hypothetical protein CP533_1886 [Ophiocordyceps camponoti-saundersi (nom. inval.)]|nr:hypothetical protein CP533_1886 [Ophiocordyceps camponoti-saundersi (nom. inval.)]